MLNLLFTNAFMLAGLSALSIPVLIHLLLKRKKKRVQFSTIQFFLKQDEQSSRRRKLRNWFLLALRLLIVSLLVLAFARPYSRNNVAAANGRKQHRVVFVLDRSASMQASGTDGQRWALAMDRVQKSISALGPDDTVAVVECSSHANVLSGFAPPAATLQNLRNLAPTFGTSSVVEGLQQAVKLLTGGDPATVSTIYLVTDLQKSACRSLSSCPVPQAIEFKILPVGDLFSPNLAIVKFDPQTTDGVRPHVVVTSFSDENNSSTSVGLSIDEQRVSSQTVNLVAGATTNIDLVIPPLKPGWHSLKTSLSAKDSLATDNERFGCLFVPEPSRILVVEPPGAAHVFEQQTFFITSALDPGKDSTNSVPGAFNLTQVTPEELPGKLRSTGGGPAWNVVIIPSLKDLPAGIGNVLSAYVQNGGGLVFFLGEGISVNRYNSELQPLLPARVGNLDLGSETGASWRIALYDTNSIAFAPFRLPNSGDLRIPEFTKRHALEPVEGAKRLAFFDDGVPLVIVRQVGKGHVTLVNTSCDTSWNDWPKHKTFVPFLHGLAKYSAQQEKRDVDQNGGSYLAGDEPELEIGPQGRSSEFTLRAPDHKEAIVRGDDHGRLTNLGLNAPGVYSLLDKSGHEIRRLAVNVPSQESDLTALRPMDFEQQLVRIQETPKQTLAAGLFGSRNQHKEFWTALLLGALILILVEPFIANRTSV